MDNYESNELSYWYIFPNDRANQKCNSVPKGFIFLAFLTISSPLFLEFLSNLSILEVHWLDFYSF